MQDRNLMTLLKSFPVTFTARPRTTTANHSVARHGSRVLEEVGGRKLRVLDAGGGRGQNGAIKMANAAIE